MEKKLLETILENTFTKADLERRLRLLKEYLVKSLFRAVKMGKVTPDLLNIKVGTSSDLTWLENLPDTFFDHFNRHNLHQILDEIDKLRQDLSTLVIQLPVEFTESELSNIGSRARSLFGKTLLIDTHIDPPLIAGCALAWSGVIKDYSIKGRIDEQKEAILESFKRSLR